MSEPELLNLHFGDSLGLRRLEK